MPPVARGLPRAATRYNCCADSEIYRTANASAFESRQSDHGRTRGDDPCRTRADPGEAGAAGSVIAGSDSGIPCQRPPRLLRLLKVLACKAVFLFFSRVTIRNHCQSLLMALATGFEPEPDGRQELSQYGSSIGRPASQWQLLASSDSEKTAYVAPVL